MHRQTIFKDNTVFEHHEMKDRITFPNPPVPRFYPNATNAEDRRLRNYQMYALAWLESRIEAGGGILGDEIGLGKVHFLVCGMF